MLSCYHRRSLKSSCQNTRSTQENYFLAWTCCCSSLPLDIRLWNITTWFSGMSVLHFINMVFLLDKCFYIKTITPSLTLTLCSLTAKSFLHQIITHLWNGIKYNNTVPSKSYWTKWKYFLTFSKKTLILNELCKQYGSRSGPTKRGAWS